MASNKAKKPPAPKSSEELVEMFDAGEDVADYLDKDKAVFRVNVDFPAWLVKELDEEAERLGINRQAVIKILVDEGIDRKKRRKNAFTQDIVGSRR